MTSHGTGVARALLQGGPHDGEHKTVPANVDIIAFGDALAAMWADEGMAIPGQQPVTYRHTATRGDGLRIYTHTQPMPVPITQCPICYGTEFGVSGEGVRYCLACPWDEA